MGKFDLNPDEVSKFDLAPGEAAPKSKYPDPKSFSRNDEELGLSFGPANTNTPGKNQALYKPAEGNGAVSGQPRSYSFDALGAQPELSPVERQLKDKYGADIDFLKEIAPYAAGGALGKLVGGAIGRYAIKPVAGRIGEAAEVMGKAIQHTAETNLNGAALKALGILVGPEVTAAARSVPVLARGAAAGAAGAARGAGAVAGSAVVPAKTTPEGGAKPYRGVWSNAVERLRASAPGNPRAQELLSRIDAIPDSGAGTDTVTQSGE